MHADHPEDVRTDDYDESTDKDIQGADELGRASEESSGNDSDTDAALVPSTPQSVQLLEVLLGQLDQVDATINKLGGPRQEELLDFVNLIRCRVQPSEKAKPDENLDVVRGKLRVPNIFGNQTRRRRQPGVQSKET